jgi:hypothetical protein
VVVSVGAAQYSIVLKAENIAEKLEPMGKVQELYGISPKNESDNNFN